MTFFSSLNFAKMYTPLFCATFYELAWWVYKVLTYANNGEIESAIGWKTMTKYPRQSIRKLIGSFMCHPNTESRN